MSTFYSNFRWGFTDERQAMLVENGRVAWRKAITPDSKVQIPGPIDLAGKWVMPAFIDAHCHILPTGLDLQKLNLGGCENHQEVLAAVRVGLDFVEEGRWLLAVHYDQTRYEGGEHLTRHDLDKISATVPILLRHVSGHASVANSAALKASGIREDEPDFTGGSFRRDASRRIDGVLLERAHERVTAAAPKVTAHEMKEAILLAGEKMAELGIACASDMMTGRFDLLQELEAYHQAAREGCNIRTRLFMQWSAVFGPRAAASKRIAELAGAMDQDLCRVAGIKIFADGAIGAGTAAIYGSYEGEPPSEESGSLIYAPERLKEMVRIAHDAGYRIAIHSIGDRSTDVVMDALEATGEPQRHRIEHAMILSDAQIARLARLGVQVTMQPEFLMRFGHAYKRQLGPERASRLKRARSVLDAGIALSFSSDRPIVAGDPRDGMLMATNRPEGFDPAENVTPSETWLGYTSRAAESNADGSITGALSAGQLADFLVFDSDPMQAQLGQAVPIRPSSVPAPGPESDHPRSRSRR